MSFDKCMHLCNPQHNQDIEHSSLQSSLLPFPPPACLCLYSLALGNHWFAFCHCRWAWLFLAFQLMASSSVNCFMSSCLLLSIVFLRSIHVVAWIHGGFLFTDEQHFTIGEHDSISIHLCVVIGVIPSFCQLWPMQKGPFKCKTLWTSDFFSLGRLRAELPRQMASVCVTF